MPATAVAPAIAGTATTATSTTAGAAKTSTAQAKHNSAVLGAKSAAAANARQARSSAVSKSDTAAAATAAAAVVERGSASPERQPCRPPLYGPDEWREVGRAFLVSLLASLRAFVTLQGVFVLHAHSLDSQHKQCTEYTTRVPYT